MASNETSKYKLTVVEGTELQLSLNGAQGPAGAVGPAGADALWNFIGEFGLIAGYISITGTLTAPVSQGATPIVFNDLLYDGLRNGKPSYRSGNQVCCWQITSNPDAWVLYSVEDDPTYAAWYSFEDVASPELVTVWNPATTETGTVTVTRFIVGVFDVGDVVTYNGETWYCNTAYTFNIESPQYPVTGSSYWQLIAAKGEDGEDGGGGVDALPLAGGAMDADAVITLDTTPDGNGFSTDSEVAGWGFGVQQKENGTNTSLSSYVYPTGFYATSDPEYVTVNASSIPSYGSLDGEIFRKVADLNLKPSYEGDLRLRYSGDRWYIDNYGGTEMLLASVGDESYPWQASWPSENSVSIIPSNNQTTHLSSTELTFDNGSKLKKGTTIADGNGGIALKCSVDYELKWEAGRLYTMEQNGFTIRRVDHCRNIAPTATDDSTKGFVVGSIWTLDDGTSYECTTATEGAAAWVAHLPLSLGDGLVFTGSTNTLNTSTNVARRAGNQTFTGNNTFSGQVELTGQALTNGTSAVTRALGDTRYGATYTGVNENNVSSTNNTPITLASVTLPIGRYQIESCISATAASSAGGFLFGLNSSAPIKVALVESYGNDNAVTISNSIGSDSTTLTQRSIGTGTTYRRMLVGIIDIITANTVVSIEFCQNTTNAVASTTRKRAYITARKIA